MLCQLLKSLLEGLHSRSENDCESLTPHVNQISRLKILSCLKNATMSQTGNGLDEEEILKKLTEKSESMPVFVVDSLSQYCELTDIIRQLWSKKARDRFIGPTGSAGEILPWFRGARNADHTLTPSLARDWIEYHKLYDSIFDLEEYYFDSFTRFGRPFLGEAMPSDEIEWSYIMRHHGIPSRLLDWTNGSLIALSYATQSYSERLDFLAGSGSSSSIHRLATSLDHAQATDAAVWMLEPRRLMETATRCLYNQPIHNITSRRMRVKAMRSDFFRDPNLSESPLMPALKDRAPRRRQRDTTYEKELSNPDLWSNKEYWMYPLPLIPSHISARVRSHLSRFTLHSLKSYVGKSSPPPEKDNGLDCFATKAYDDDKIWYLVKIELPCERLHAIARVLRMTGVADMNLTQDLDGLSRELKLRAALGYLDDKG